VEQESLANANVSAQSSACKKALVKKSMTNQRKESWKVHSVGYKRCRRFYIHSFSCCCLQNLRNPVWFSQKFEAIKVKVIQGHRSWCRSKAHMQFLFVIIITLDVCPTVFEILTHLARKQLIFPHHPCLTPP